MVLHMTNGLFKIYVSLLKAAVEASSAPCMRSKYFKIDSKAGVKKA